MDPSEADSRFGPTALRALDDAVALAAREPRVALTQARKAVEAVALHLYAREVGDPDASSRRLMLDDLLKALSKQKLIPEGVGMHFGTVQRYGNYGSHPQADDASVGNTVAFNQPCVESLRFIARWYIKDKLRLAEADIPPGLRTVALAASAVPPEPARSSTGSKPVTAPSPADPFGLAGAYLEDKYRIDAMVAEGGFGVVYRATHLTLDKPLAVKVLKVPEGMTDAMRATFLDGFAREAKTIARLEHPAIVKVLDYGVSPMPTGQPAPWAVLEWLTGTTLEGDLVRRKGQPGRTPAEALAILRPVMQALAYAHAEGVAHRDIKPANIMLPGAAGSATTPGAAARRGELAAKLLDFGIAKVMGPDETEASGSTHTRSSLTAFSLPYAAPEQVSSTRTGPWTDVHALALVVVSLLTNRPPYAGGDAQDLYAAVLSPTRPTPARFGLDVGPWEAVLAKALASKPSDRYPDAGALLDALEADVPVEARRVEVEVAKAPPSPSDARPAEARGPDGATLRGAERPSTRRGGMRREVYFVAGAAVFALVAAEALFASGGSEVSSQDDRALATTPAPVNASAVITAPTTLSAHPTPDASAADVADAAEAGRR